MHLVRCWPRVEGWEARPSNPSSWAAVSGACEYSCLAWISLQPHTGLGHLGVSRKSMPRVFLPLFVGHSGSLKGFPSCPCHTVPVCLILLFFQMQFKSHLPPPFRILQLNRTTPFIDPSESHGRLITISHKWLCLRGIGEQRATSLLYRHSRILWFFVACNTSRCWLQASEQW